MSQKTFKQFQVQTIRLSMNLGEKTETSFIIFQDKKLYEFSKIKKLEFLIALFFNFQIFR